MATKKKSVNNVDFDYELENKNLKNEIEQMKAMMLQLTNMAGEKVQTGVENKIDNQEVEEELVMQPNQLVNITSLFSGGLNLMGAHGKVIRLETFGRSLSVTFEDLSYICSNNRAFAEEGYFYIHNDKAIKLLYLQDAYNKIINSKMIESMITLTNEEIERIYNNTTKNLKDTISDIIVRGIKENKPQFSDRNKIDFISKLYGKDLDVVAKQMREYDLK